MMKFGTPGGDGDSREIVFDDFQPDRRMITQLEIDVALFRDLLRKGVVPKGESFSHVGFIMRVCPIFL